MLWRSPIKYSEVLQIVPDSVLKQLNQALRWPLVNGNLDTS